MTTTHTLSAEQLDILRSWEQGYSVKIQAVFGAGKTLCLLRALEIAYYKSPTSQIVFVSYNRDLVNDAITKCNNLFPIGWQKRIFVGTYHSLLGSITNQIIQDDLVFLQALHTLASTNRNKYTWQHQNFSHLLTDEGQDLKPPYCHSLLQTIYRFSQDPFHLQRMHVGDENQILYTFYSVNKADTRFLTHMDQIVPGNWRSHQLTTSYRATPAMAHFIHFLFPEKPRILPNPHKVSYKPVLLFITDLWNGAPEHLLPVIEQYYNNGKKTFILCSSINEKSPCISLVDRLVQAKLPVYVNRSGNLSDHSNSSQQTTSQENNFIQVKTYHASKGCECDLNIVYIRDNLFGSDLTPAHYVALGRGREELIVVLDYRYTTLSQLSKFQALTQRDVRILVDRQLEDNIPEKKEKKEQDEFHTQSLFSFIDVSHLQKLVSMFSISAINCQSLLTMFTPAEQYLQSLTITTESNHLVNVSQIVGAAITYAVEFTITKKLPECVVAMITDCRKKNEPKYKCLGREMEDVATQLVYSDEVQFVPNVVCQKLTLFAKMATLMDAFCGYTEKVAFLTSFQFMETPDIFQRYKQLFYHVLYLLSTHNIQPHQLKWYQSDVGWYEYGGKKLHICSKPTIASELNIAVEIVHKPKITYEDHLRALMSGQIVGGEQAEKAACYVINIVTGQMERATLHPVADASLYFIRAAINGKIFEEKTISDAVFLQQYHDYIKRIL